jgi:hypothetical protein
VSADVSVGAADATGVRKESGTSTDATMVIPMRVRRSDAVSSRRGRKWRIPTSV